MRLVPASDQVHTKSRQIRLCSAWIARARRRAGLWHPPRSDPGSTERSCRTERSVTWGNFGLLCVNSHSLLRVSSAALRLLQVAEAGLWLVVAPIVVRERGVGEETVDDPYSQQEVEEGVDQSQRHDGVC